MAGLTGKEIIDILNVGRRDGFQGKNLTRANLQDADLAGYNFVNVLMDGANLAGADLTGAHMDLVHLTRANLTNAKLEKAVMNGAKLDGADLTGAKLQNSYLNSAHLTSAKLTGANLTGASLHDALLTGAILDNANLTNASLQGAHLNRASVKTTNLTGAILDRADIAGANFTGTMLLHEQLYRAQNADKAKLPVGMNAPVKDGNSKIYAVIDDRIGDGMELSLLINHLIEFYRDEQNNKSKKMDLGRLEMMRKKQKELALKVMAKAKEFIDFPI